MLDPARVFECVGRGVPWRCAGRGERHAAPGARRRGQRGMGVSSERADIEMPPSQRAAGAGAQRGGERPSGLERGRFSSADGLGQSGEVGTRAGAVMRHAGHAGMEVSPGGARQVAQTTPGAGAGYNGETLGCGTKEATAEPEVEGDKSCGKRSAADALHASSDAFQCVRAKGEMIFDFAKRRVQCHNPVRGRRESRVHWSRVGGSQRLNMAPSKGANGPAPGGCNPGAPVFLYHQCRIPISWRAPFRCPRFAHLVPGRT